MDCQLLAVQNQDKKPITLTFGSNIQQQQQHHDNMMPGKHTYTRTAQHIWKREINVEVKIYDNDNDHGQNVHLQRPSWKQTHTHSVASAPAQQHNKEIMDGNP